MGIPGLSAFVLATLVAATISTDTGPPQADAAAKRQPDAGRTLYIEHCAGCHGMSGQGDGPAAASMRRPPTDLTGYAQRNGGVFPAERLRSIVDGRGVGAHGSVEMPVWGSVFKAASGSNAAARDRIEAIVAYVRSLQARAGD